MQVREYKYEAKSPLIEQATDRRVHFVSGRFMNDCATVSVSVFCSNSPEAK